MPFAVFITIGAVTKAAMLPGCTALWFEYWPGDLKVPGRCPVPSVAVAAVPNFTLIAPVNPAVYKWVNLSHRYCEEFGDLSQRSSTQFRETSLERIIIKKQSS